VIAAVVALGGCGAHRMPAGRIAGDDLTVYAGVPMQGASSVTAVAILNGATLALEQMHGQIGRYRIALKPLDDATTHRGQWDPGQTTTDAHQVVTDPTAIGYIGDLNSGASAVSIPILNRAEIAQISPLNTAVGLTSGASGAAPGEPDKYYPTGLRTYARNVPNDTVQAAVQVKLQQSFGCTKTYVVDDGEVDGQDTANSFVLAAQAAGLDVVGTQEYDPHATDYTAFASGIASTGADCILISAITDSNAVLVTEQLAAALPAARLFGVAGLAETTYADPAKGGIPVELDPRVLITAAPLAPSLYPPSGRRFLADYTALFGTPELYAIFGYDAMTLMLEAISRATHGGRSTAQRSKVVKEIFSTRDRDSVLGPYTIDSGGDTSLNTYGVWRIVDGKLVFWKAVTG
jgi:branched-chain amino acid transport system substrate-binding protein